MRARREERSGLLELSVHTELPVKSEPDSHVAPESESVWGDVKAGLLFSISDGSSEADFCKDKARLCRLRRNSS